MPICTFCIFRVQFVSLVLSIEAVEDYGLVRTSGSSGQTLLPLDSYEVLEALLLFLTKSCLRFSIKAETK